MNSVISLLPYHVAQAIKSLWRGDDSLDNLSDAYNYLALYSSAQFESRTTDTVLHTFITVGSSAVMKSNLRSTLRGRIVALDGTRSGEALQGIYTFLSKAQHGIVSYNLLQECLALTSPVVLDIVQESVSV